MDIDENDILLTNQFVSGANVTSDVPDEYNEEFRQFYRNEISEPSRGSLERLSIRSIQLDEENDANSLMNTNRFVADKGSIKQNVEYIRKTKEVKTYVSIDSRDRNQLLYSKSNYFKIFLGKTFYNVKKIRLAGVEFPNTNAVINSTNNKLYWRNQQDIDTNEIDNITGTYPVYEVQLRIGSYIVSSLQTEITDKIILVKRKSNMELDYHYFLVTLDIDTDIVTFTSLLLKQAPNNALSTSVGTGIITVNQVNHGYKTGDRVYIVGAKTFAGIQSTTINGFYNIDRVNANQFQFEVNVKAAETTNGGGNTVKTGVEAPFQFLFGEHSNTIAPNIGFPMENSSQRINTYIKQMVNIYLIQLEFTSPHPFTNTYSYIGQSGVIAASGTTPNVDGTRSIAKIVNSTTILVIGERLDFSTYNTGTFTFNGTTYNLSKVSNNLMNTVLITTFTSHNYNVSDIGTTITFYDTITTPNLDGPHDIYSVYSDTQLLIPGTLYSGGEANVSSPGKAGSAPRYKPLETITKSIKNITPGAVTRITCVDHSLKVGDYVKFVDVVTYPSILSVNSGVFTVYSIPDADNFTVNYTTTSVDDESILNGKAKILTKKMKLSLPGHGFNNIIDISNGYTPKTIASIINSSIGIEYKAIITTSTPHLLTTGDLIRISGSDCVPNVNGSNIEVDVLSPTTFEIITPQDVTSNGSAGQVSLNQMTILVTTLLPHNLSTGSKVRIMKTDTFPSIDGGGYTVTNIGSHVFQIVDTGSGLGLTTPGTTGIIGMNHDFYLYGVSDIGGLTSNNIVGKLYTVSEIIDKDTFIFEGNDFALFSEKGGGSNMYISSLFHGFSGVQANTKNSLLNRSINLEGENYAFLCCPQLATMMNTGYVENIFARITLDQSPGSMVFTYLSNPKEFDNAPLDKLDELEFSVVNYDNTLYEFNDLDYSFVLEITEVKDVTDNFNFSSKRGVVE